MSLHSIFSFHAVSESGVTPIAKEAETEAGSEPERQVISATWRATADALRASLKLEEEPLGSSPEMT